jgi:hypothetical protein
MAQITVTVDDDLFMEMIERLPKGMKSKFVNQAIYDALSVLRDDNGVIYFGAAVLYARKGYDAATEYCYEERKRLRELEE